MYNDIKILALKNRVITVGTIIVCTLLIIGAILFPKQTIDITNSNEMKELTRRREVLERQNDALLDLVKEQSKTTIYYQQRDSILQAEIQLNRKAIQKIKLTNETIKMFDNYGSSEWTSYFANLPDPE